jgi:ferritin-like metal-binding protein YciE
MPTTKTRSAARTRRTRSGGEKATASSNRSSSKSLKKTSRPENGMEDGRSQLEKLFTDSLKDIYWAEKHLTKVLPKMKKAATTDELISAIEEHLAQTEEHVSRLEQVFEICGKKAQAKKCDAMEGLTKEGDSVVEETEKGTMTRDAGIIMAAQKVEHYEIATYGTLVQFAKTLGMDDAVELLEQTLEEEKETDQRLTEIAEANINQGAEQEKDEEEEEDDEEEETESSNDDDEEEEK